MIERGLYQRLVDTVPAVGSRVYPVLLPQNVTYPAITYDLVVDPRALDHSGRTNTTRASYQITSWSPSYATAKIVARAVRESLEDFSGAMDTASVSTIFADGGRDLYDDDVKIHHHAADYTILYKET
jgi:hypothetical protein